MVPNLPDDRAFRIWPRHHPRLARTREHEIVQEGVAGTGIESNQIVVRIDIGDVGDAADVENRNRGQSSAAASAWWYNDTSRAPAPGRHVGSPEIVRHRDPEPPCQPRSVANLDGQP